MTDQSIVLTVSDALGMPVFAGAQVVAGRAGLSRRVGWVHVAGVPDAPDWLNGGELVLTTPYTLPETESEQQAYVRAMADKDVAGLAVAVGRYSEATPAVLRETAEACGFPLIEIPYTTRFVEVARAINERISQQTMLLKQRAMDINSQLTRLVLDGGDLQELAETLAGLIGQSISIENESFESLASHNIADVDEARRYTLSEGRTNPHLIRTLEERGVLETIRRTLRPVHLPQIPEVGLEMERILAPIVVHGEIYGYVWIIADDRPLSDLDQMAVETGATIAALMLLYREATQNAEASLKGGLISQLLKGDDVGDPARQAALIDQALRYGVNLAAPFALLAAAPRRPDAGVSSGLLRRINRLATERAWNVVAGQFAGQVVLVSAAGAAQAIAAELGVAFLPDTPDAQSPSLYVAVSAPVRHADDAPAAYQQCLDALAIASRMGMTQSVVSFERLGFLHTLYRAGRDSLAANPLTDALRLLQNEQGADLFRTLETFVDAGGSGVQTAELLMIHRSTLNYRLARISEICQMDLGDPLTRTNAQVAVKLLRLFGDIS